MNAAATPLQIFRAKGVPNRRMEDWKYTDVRAAVDAQAVEAVVGVRIHSVVPVPIEVFTDNPAQARSASIRPLASLGSMEAAARAFSPRKTVLRVPDRARVEEPLEIEYLSSGHCEIEIHVGKGASLTLVEKHLAKEDGLQNVLLSIILDQGGQLTHVREAPFGERLAAVETVSVVQAAGSRYRVYLLEGGARLSRAEFNITLQGDGAEADLAGVSVLGDEAHADITTHVDHAVPNTTSRQLFKKVAGGHSRAVYQGKITVREGAVGSDSKQTAKAILLGGRAEADLKPELEILADDVKCAHGAAIGDLDAESLFYLRSRGIPETEARSLLLRAFLEEAVDTIEDEALRVSAWKFVENSLAHAMKAAT